MPPLGRVPVLADLCERAADSALQPPGEAVQGRLLYTLWHPVCLDCPSVDGVYIRAWVHSTLFIRPLPVPTEDVLVAEASVCM